MLLAIGVQMEERGAGLSIKDSYGKHRATPSKIDRNLSKEKLEEKFGPFHAASPLLKKNVKREETYQALPLHQGPDRGNLYEEFKFEMAVRKSELERIKIEEGVAFQTIRQKWNDHRKSLQNRPMMYEHRQRLLLEMKIKEQEEMVGNRAELAEKRQTIREAIPYTSWNKCLQHKAAQGNEVALAILRSKNMEVAPEAGNTGIVNSAYKTMMS